MGLRAKGAQGSLRKKVPQSRVLSEEALATLEFGHKVKLQPDSSIEICDLYFLLHCLIHIQSNSNWSLGLLTSLVPIPFKPSSRVTKADMCLFIPLNY